jgi:integrase
MPRRPSPPRLDTHRKRPGYYIYWTEGGRSRERSTGTDDLREAETVFADWLAQRQRAGGPCDPSEVLVTDCLAEYAENAIERAQAGKVMAADRIAYAIGPLSTFFEGRMCNAVTEDTCRDYGRWRQRSDGTVRRELGVLRAALNMAHRKNRITRQIAVELPDAPPSKERWLKRREAAALIRAARASSKGSRHLSQFILIGLYTGKRKEAILSLNWSQVDLDAGVINWERQTGPRTNKRRGRNPVNRKLLAHLRRWKRADVGPVIAYNARPVKDIKKGFAAACERAGLEDVTPHTLRHTCATWLMQHGVSTWQAAGFLGMTEETLLRIYGHHHPKHQLEAATAF